MEVRLVLTSIKSPTNNSHPVKAWKLLNNVTQTVQLHQQLCFN